VSDLARAIFEEYQSARGMPASNSDFVLAPGALAGLGIVDSLGGVRQLRVDELVSRSPLPAPIV
jgi:hypothetical protein